MTDTPEHDPVWQKALDWVLCTHRQPLDADTASDLAAWLDEDPAHRQAYDEAARVWLLTGLVPPADDEEA